MFFLLHKGCWSGLKWAFSNGRQAFTRQPFQCSFALIQILKWMKINFLYFFWSKYLGVSPFLSYWNFEIFWVCLILAACCSSKRRACKTRRRKLVAIQKYIDRGGFTKIFDTGYFKERYSRRYGRYTNHQFFTLKKNAIECPFSVVFDPLQTFQSVRKVFVGGAQKNGNSL